MYICISYIHICLGSRACPNDLVPVSISALVNVPGLEMQVALDGVDACIELSCCNVIPAFMASQSGCLVRV